MVLELDARNYMSKLGVKGVKPPTDEEKAKNKLALV